MTASDPIPLLDLKLQYQAIQDEILKAVHGVLDAQHFILGPEVEKAERLVAAYSQSAYGIGVSSGSDALLVSLMAEGIGHGDEVITSPYTFFATIGAIARVGAKPVFVDIDPETWNIDPEQIPGAISAKTRAIIPVHLFGQMADMEPILELAKKHRFIVIEDAAQALGAEYKNHRAGSLGDYGCFSFFPSKNLGAAGDAGMVVTQNDKRASKIRLLRNHGASPKYFHSLIGGNFRLDAIQAAVVSVKMAYLEEWTLRRQSNAARYEIMFQRSGLTTEGLVRTPKVKTNRHIFNQYILRVSHRNELKGYLKQNHIETEIYYPHPMHLQECFRFLGFRPGDFPQSEKAAAETLAIPIFPELTDHQAARVVETVQAFYGTK